MPMHSLMAVSREVNELVLQLAGELYINFDHLNLWNHPSG